MRWSGDRTGHAVGQPRPTHVADIRHSKMCQRCCYNGTEYHRTSCICAVVCSGISCSVRSLAFEECRVKAKINFRCSFVLEDMRSWQRTSFYDRPRLENGSWCRDGMIARGLSLARECRMCQKFEMLVQGSRLLSGDVENIGNLCCASSL
jgi:hypothetical protein